MLYGEASRAACHHCGCALSATTDECPLCGTEVRTPGGVMVWLVRCGLAVGVVSLILT